MSISLRSIRYGNFGGSDAPYVTDVYSLNAKRDWGLKINPDGAWVQAKKQLELIDSISIAILNDEAVQITLPERRTVDVVANDVVVADLITYLDSPLNESVVLTHPDRTLPAVTSEDTVVFLQI